jgi:hypothetical protein
MSVCAVSCKQLELGEAGEALQIAGRSNCHTYTLIAALKSPIMRIPRHGPAPVLPPSQVLLASTKAN